MKVYVIKNKEGKYWNVIYGFRDDISRATIEPYPNKMKLQKDEYWQEVTLCEGELNEELEVYKRALELACATHQFEDTCDYCEYFEENGQCPAYCDIQENFMQDQAIQYFMNQARKELEEKDEN